MSGDLKNAVGGRVNDRFAGANMLFAKVFDDLGPYRKAHNTEDMEIAFRMQVNNLRIRQCNDAYVYTVGPKNIPTLFKQRLRWIFGFNCRRRWLDRHTGDVESISALVNLEHRGHESDVVHRWHFRCGPQLFSLHETRMEFVAARLHWRVCGVVFWSPTRDAV